MPRNEKMSIEDIIGSNGPDQLAYLRSLISDFKHLHKKLLDSAKILISTKIIDYTGQMHRSVCVFTQVSLCPEDFCFHTWHF